MDVAESLLWTKASKIPLETYDAFYNIEVTRRADKESQI